jgi:hypothetical protein
MRTRWRHRHPPAQGIREISQLTSIKKLFVRIVRIKIRNFFRYISKFSTKNEEEIGQELRRFLRSFCQVLRSFLRMFFWILFLNLIVMSKKFEGSFEALRSFFQYSFEVLRTFLRSSSKLLSKTFEFIGKNNFQIVFKLLENSVFFQRCEISRIPTNKKRHRCPKPENFPGLVEPSSRIA